MKTRSNTVRLRKWTKETLTKDDYAFAISRDRKPKRWRDPQGGWREAPENDWWNCPAVRWWNSDRPAAWRLAVDCLDWELERELAACKKPPFLAEKKHQDRADVIEDLSMCRPPPRLTEIRNVKKAATWLREQPFQQRGVSIHAFAIDRDEDAKTITKRFRRWLVQFKQLPDPRAHLVNSHGCTWVGELSKSRVGRKRNAGRLLRALAVYRLKKAGVIRKDSEGMLNLFRDALHPWLWRDLPDEAESAIKSLLMTLEETEVETRRIAAKLSSYSRKTALANRRGYTGMVVARHQRILELQACIAAVFRKSAEGHLTLISVGDMLKRVGLKRHPWRRYLPPYPPGGGE